MQIVLATNNRGKLEEIKHFFKSLDIDFLCLDDFKNFPNVVEDGKTLEENAIKKAKQVSLFTKLPALSDDTGLEVDFLNGAPGVYSARFAGENVTYDDNNQKLIEMLKDIPLEKRTAIFKTVVTFFIDEKKYFCVEGICQGLILDDYRGNNGFGYDPIFFVPEKNKTFAEMNLDEKNQISHRSRALEKMKNVLTEYVLKNKI
jgi:XTP/dITP diphosphohydrolase